MPRKVSRRRSNVFPGAASTSPCAYGNLRQLSIPLCLDTFPFLRVCTPYVLTQRSDLGASVTKEAGLSLWLEGSLETSDICTQFSLKPRHLHGVRHDYERLLPHLPLRCLGLNESSFSVSI